MIRSSNGSAYPRALDSYDDIVWRGNLSSRWFEANSNTVGHFGDIDLTFELMEY